ncbi:MAG: insulinase family protein [Candidatus Scalindua sp.]|nr:insulinase family protein [Candidatus Scalindua sp.]
MPIDFKKTTLDNGLRIVVVEHHKFPVVAVNLLVRAGSVHDPQGHEGLANIVAQLLREGTHEKDSLEIADAIDFIGGTLSVESDCDSTSVTASALAKHFTLILKVLSDVTRSPAFPPEKTEFQRNRSIASILREKDNKMSLGSRNFIQMLYGMHPYGHPPIGTVNGLKSIKREAILAFHKEHFLPNNSILTVVGDINTATVLAAIEEIFGKWKKGDTKEILFPPIHKINGHTVRIVDKPDLTQTDIHIGHIGIKRTEPDYFAIVLLNYVLGRGPVSRLYTKLRAEKGLTYGVTSMFDSRNLRGPFFIRTYSKNESAVEVLQIVLDELLKITLKGVTRTELDRAKSYYAGNFPLSIETPSQIAAKIIEQEFYGLPEDYVTKYLIHINEVSLEEVNHAAKRVLDPGNVVAVLVSKAEDILDEARGLGVVEVKEP